MQNIILLRKNDSQELDAELIPYLDNSPPFPVLQHPLVTIPYTGDNRVANMLLAQKKETLRVARENKKWSTYVFAHERFYRINAFVQVEYEINDDDYWNILSSVWIDADNIWFHKVAWRYLWNSSRSNKHLTMNEDEQTSLANLPDKITVYRGTSIRKGIHNLSWTLDKERAKWFAQRHNSTHTGFLISGVTQKKHVHAHFKSRSEEEIIVESRFVKNKTITEV